MAIPGKIELLRAFVEAHEVPLERTGTREPILYLKYLGGADLQHHAFEAEPFATVDDALLEEMHGDRLIDIDYRENSWLIVPTPEGRSVIEAVDRVESLTPVAEVGSIVEAISAQSESSNKLAWPMVRPVLLGIKRYWEEGGFSEHGVALAPLVNSIPEDQRPLFSATVRSLNKAAYLRPTTELAIEGIPAEVDITDKAHAVLDGWPGAAPEDLFENLVAVLRSEMETTASPQQKKKLEKVLESVREVGVATVGEVLAKVATGGI